MHTELRSQEFVFTIRTAKPADYPDMDAVFRASAKAFCSASYGAATIDEWAGQAWPDRFVLGKQQGDEQYVVTTSGRIVCFGCINLASGKLVSLFVHPEFSGQQVGRLMLECLLDRASSAGCDVLKLDSSLNAANFYRRHGFTEVGRSKYRTQGGVHVDSIQMERVLRHATSGPSSQAL